MPHTTEHSKQVDKLLHKADLDLIRFAHVIRGWGGVFPEAVADSLSLIVLQGDTFCRSLTQIHSPHRGCVEIRNIYRAGFEGTSMSLIDPYVTMELVEGSTDDTSRVTYGDALTDLKEHLRTLYGDVAKVATPVFDVYRYLIRNSWWVYGYNYQRDSTTVQLTDGDKCVTITVNHIPMGLDKRAIAEYVKHRKDH